MNSKKIKLTVATIAAVLLLAFLWFSIHGVTTTIDKTLPLDVFSNENNPDHQITGRSSVTIQGKLKRTLFPSARSFVGTFAVEAYEPSCREGTEAEIKWYGVDGGSGSQNITFYQAGDFSRLDVLKIEIDEEMEHLMLLLQDGTVITTPDYYVTGEVWMNLPLNLP